jgi:hypothetical protein
LATPIRTDGRPFDSIRSPIVFGGERNGPSDVRLNFATVNVADGARDDE